MSTAGRVIKNTGYLYAKMGITMFVSLYTTRLILNFLGASDFGIYSIVGGAIGMLGFLSAAMAGATQRFMSYSEGEGDKEKQKNIFNVSIFLHICVALILGLILLVAGYFFFNGVLNIPSDRVGAARIVYVSMILSTMFTVSTVPYDAVLNAHENMKYYAIIGILESFLKLMVALVCVKSSYDKLVVYGILMACIPLITLTIMRAYCHRHYEECVINIRKYWSKSLMKDMTSFAGWNLTSTAVVMISSYGQGIILNHFWGTKLNAAQGVTSQLNGQLQTLAQNMLKALNPVIGKSAGAHNEDLFKRSTLLGAKYSTALYLVFAIPMFVEAPYILQLWLKNVPEWTVIFVRFQLIRSFIEFQLGTLPKAIAATGKIKNFTIWSSLSNILQLPTIYLLFQLGFPPYSMYVAAIVFGNIFVYVAASYYARKLCGIPVGELIKNILAPISIIAVITISSLFLLTGIVAIDNIMMLLIFIVVSVILFVALFCIIGCTSDERLIFKSILKPVILKVFSVKK